jgi:hypothetical protein
MNFDAILNHILDLLVKPTEEWERIKNAGTPDLKTLQQYLLNRFIPIVLLNVGTYFVGVALIGVRNKEFMDGARLVSPIAAIIASIVLAVAYFLIIIVGGMIIKLIATSFDSEVNEINSFKLAAFSLYPLLFIDNLHIIPGIKLGTIAGLYGTYLLYTGLPILLKTPPEKCLGFTLVITLAVIGMLSLAFALVNTISGAGPLLRIGF